MGIKVKNLWLVWHRWIGLVACIGMVLWGLSGASHPIMTRLQPVPKQMMPPLPAVNLSQVQALPSLLAAYQLGHFSHISLAQVAGVSTYRIAIPGRAEALYLRTDNGKVHADERRHAIELACYYTGLPASAVKAVRRLTAFEADYHPVNRLLPVWRVDFVAQGGLRAYVDSEQSRLATLVDDRRAMLTAWFQFGHQWSFLQSAGQLQIALASVVLGLILASAITGLTLYIRQAGTARYRLRRLSLPWWHRQLGLWVALVILLLASSGLWHLRKSDAQQQRPALLTGYVADSAALSTALWQQLLQAQSAQAAVRKLDIYGRGSQLFWQVISANAAMPAAQVAALHQHANAHHSHGAGAPSVPDLYFSAQATLTALEAADYARLWALHLAQVAHPALQGTDWIFSFANEYGFIFKRLPVLKLQTGASDGQRWYVEPATGVVAASINNSDGLEGFVFAYLHKWSVQSIPKDIRDGFAMLAALMIAVLGVMGAILFWRR